MTKASPENPIAAVRRLEFAGYAALILFFASLGVWAITARIAGAVVAAGSIVVQSSPKKIQHPTGGVISAIYVQDGQQVRSGQLLLRMDATVARATVGVIRVQIDELEARQARLLAERDNLDSISFPSNLRLREDDQQLAATLAGEQRLFESRRNAKRGQNGQLEQRILQSREEIRGLEAQKAAKQQEIDFIDKELSGVTELWDKNLVAITKLMQLQRDKARLSGDLGQYIAEAARARGKISETELQIIQLQKDFQSEVLKDLREAQGKIAELKERLVAAEDQLKRTDVVAPQDGIVNQLSVHTVGGVITSGEVLMEIVPQGDELVVESKVDPRDIDQVRNGARAIVRILAGDQRENPDLVGHVTLVSADLDRDPSVPADRSRAGAAERASYKVRVELPPAEVERLGQVKLIPGMQAETFIQTYARTPLQYLVKPLEDQIVRTFRER